LEPLEAFDVVTRA